MLSRLICLTYGADSAPHWFLARCFLSIILLPTKDLNGHLLLATIFSSLSTHNATPAASAG